jgi:hypothetical protein
LTTAPRTNRRTSSDRANYERKSWGRTFGPKKDGKRFVAKADRRAGRAACRRAARAGTDD